MDNVCGITGIMMEIGRGTIRSIICEEDYIVDLIPVDLVVNTLITAAWRTGTHHANNVQVSYPPLRPPCQPISLTCPEGHFLNLHPFLCRRCTTARAASSTPCTGTSSAG